MRKDPGRSADFAGECLAKGRGAGRAGGFGSLQNRGGRRGVGGAVRKEAKPKTRKRLGTVDKRRRGRSHWDAGANSPLTRSAKSE